MKKLLLIAALLPLLAHGQLANQGFEDWETAESTNEEYPSGWPLLAGQYLFKETDAYQGEYALTVSAWYAYLKTVAIQENAIDSRPSSFNGYYKYTDNTVHYYDQDNVAHIGPDTAIVSVFLTKWDPVAMQKDTIATGTVELESSANYSQFSIPLEYFSEAVPDSVKVIFDPSKVRRFHPDIYAYRAYNFMECSFFTIDNLYFSNEALQTPELNTIQDITLYPNPVVDVFKIRVPENKSMAFTLYDSAGKKLSEGIIQGSDDEIDVAGLASGIYYVILSDSSGQLVENKKLVKK